MRLFAVSLLLLFVPGCQKSSAPISPAGAPPFQPPTATEVFNLRSKCAELGEKIMKNNVIGAGRTQSQLSHYEPKTNRCYVQLTVSPVDPAKGDDYFQQSLYDGQTGLVLAGIRRENGKKFGEIFADAHPMSGNPDEMYLDATLFIGQMMVDDGTR